MSKRLGDFAAMGRGFCGSGTLDQCRSWVKKNGQGKVYAKFDEDTICISGIWLRRIGDNVEVLVERKIDGKRTWIKVISETVQGSFSNIVEPSGILKMVP